MEPAIKAEEGVALPTKSQPAGTQPEPEAQPADGNSMDVKPDPQPEPPLKEEAEQQIEPPEPENLLVADPPLVMTEEDQASLANDLSDPQVSLWYKVTQPVRASVLVEAHLDSLKPFPERKALVRDSLGMGEYEKGFGRYLDRCAKIRGEGVEEYEEVDGDGGLSPESIHGRRALSAEPSKEGEEPPAEEQLLQHVDYFLPELFPMGSVPGIEGPPEVVGADLFEKHGTAPMPSASAYQSARPCESGLTDTIGTGTAEMRKIQDLYVRIGEVTNGTDHTIKGWKRNRVGAWGDEARLPPLRVGEEIGHAAMKSACGRLLAHEGFEVTKADALNVVADAAVERLMLLGRMLRTYVDDFAGEMEPEQMIRHTLVDAGMRDIESFTDYVEGVVGAGKARKNLRDKMEKRYKDLLKDAIRSEDAEFVLDEVEGEPGTAIRVIGLEELGIALDEVCVRLGIGFGPPRLTLGF